MKIKYDRVADATYIYLKYPVAASEAAHMVAVRGTSVVLDFDAKGQLLGIEIHDASRVAPSTMQAGEEIS